MATTNAQYRPATLAEIVGQDEVRQYLKIKIGAAAKSGAPISHTLFLGPSGAGKTTFAQALANELGSEYVEIFAPTMKDPAVLIDILSKLSPNAVVFVDEIHAFAPKLQEVLYTALEDGVIRCVNKCKQECTIPLNPFTMIGATTHEGRLNEPLRKRFLNQVRMRPYTVVELSLLLKRAAEKQFGIVLDDRSAERIASVSQGIPRMSRNLLKSVVEVAQESGKQISTQVVDETLKYEELDPLIGLTRKQRMYLVTLATEGAMGAKGISTMLGEQIETVEFAIEPFLMQEVELPAEFHRTSPGGLVRRTTKGREITKLGLEYLSMCKYLQGKGWFAGESFVDEH